LTEQTADEAPVEWPTIARTSKDPGGVQVVIVLSSGEARSDFKPYTSLYNALFGSSGAGAMINKTGNARTFLGSNRCRLFIAGRPRDDHIFVVDGEQVFLVSRRRWGMNSLGLPSTSRVREAITDPSTQKRPLSTLRALIK
jgi:hypothetical protein